MFSLKYRPYAKFIFLLLFLQKSSKKRLGAAWDLNEGNQKILCGYLIIH